jgi:predicted Zn-dependent peptidase
MVAGLALRCLCGRSSPFYLRLYSQGLLNSTFGSSTDYAAGQGMVAFEGESKDPHAVLQALNQEIDRVCREGFDQALFQRQKQASLGGRLRALTNFYGLAVSMVEGCFAGYQPLDAFELLEKITCDQASAWVREYLKPERLAMSVIYPKEN